MNRIKWSLLSAAVVGLCVAAIVRAQTDDPFGPASTEVRPAADPQTATPLAEQDLFDAAPAPQQTPGLPSPVPTDDVFGPATAAPAATQQTANPFQPSRVQPVPVQPVPQRASAESNGKLCRCDGEANLAAITRIEKALDAPLRGRGLDFSDTPLEEIVHLLQDEYDIPIQIDAAALDELGLGVDEPVSVTLQNISLRSALRLILKSVQLTSVIEHEVLLITTPEDVESRMKICVYDVRDFVDDNPRDTAPLVQLMDVITSSVSSKTWVENGSAGSIRSYPPNLLIISQTQAVHEQIQDLLQRMRQMRQESRGTEKSATVPKR